MMRSNLAVLLAERNKKITRVANDTKISRTTLTGLTQNTSKMVQFDTVDTLCKYLDIEPSEFFEYVPFSMNFNAVADFDHLDSEEEEARGGYLYWKIDGYLNIVEKERHETVSYSGYAEAFPTQDPNDTLNVTLKINDADISVAREFFGRLSTAFSTDIRTKMLAEAWESLVKCAKESRTPDRAEIAHISVEFLPGEKVDADFPF